MNSKRCTVYQNQLFDSNPTPAQTVTSGPFYSAVKAKRQFNDRDYSSTIDRTSSVLRQRINDAKHLSTFARKV